MIDQTLRAWHRVVGGEVYPAEGLAALLHDDVVFYSPVVFTPQRGREITSLYLLAAMQTLGQGGFRYTREVASGHDAVLEFETTLDGKLVNGVDILHCDDEGLITEFRVMVRPLQAVDAVHSSMAAMLDQLRG